MKVTTPLTKTELIQRFQLHQTVDYHVESTRRYDKIPRNSLRKASVLIGFVQREHGLNIVLTKRAEHLKHHPGQISFPGGKYEEGDQTLYRTAIREAEEEIGITASDIETFGQLPEIVTISKFSVTPIMAFINPDYQAEIDPNEVEEVFEVPADHLLDKNKLYSGIFQVKSQPHRIFAIPYQRHFIWGMTAQIIQALQRHINIHHK